MQNRVYLKQFSEETNNKVDKIRRFVGVDSYQELRFILQQIDESLCIPKYIKLHLKTYYGFESEVLTISAIEEYIDFFYKLNSGTLSMLLIEFNDCVYDLITAWNESINKKYKGFNNLCKKILKKITG